MTPGELAYNAYCESRGWKAFNGDPLPTYAAMAEDPKRADLIPSWEVAGRAAQEPFRKVVAALVGESDPEKLRVMLDAVGLIPAPASDKAAAIDAIELLLQ